MALVARFICSLDLLFVSLVVTDENIFDFITRKNISLVQTVLSLYDLLQLSV